MSVDTVQTLLSSGVKVSYFDGNAYVSVEDFEGAVDDLRFSRHELVKVYTAIDRVLHSYAELQELRSAYDWLLGQVLTVGLAGSELAKERAKTQS